MQSQAKNSKGSKNQKQQSMVRAFLEETSAIGKLLREKLLKRWETRDQPKQSIVQQSINDPPANRIARKERRDQVKKALKEKRRAPTKEGRRIKLKKRRIKLRENQQKAFAAQRSIEISIPIPFRQSDKKNTSGSSTSSRGKGTH